MKLAFGTSNLTREQQWLKMVLRVHLSSLLSFLMSLKVGILLTLVPVLNDAY